MLNRFSLTRISGRSPRTTLLLGGSAEMSLNNGLVSAYTGDGILRRIIIPLYKNGVIFDRTQHSKMTTGTTKELNTYIVLRFYFRLYVSGIQRLTPRLASWILKSC